MYNNYTAVIRGGDAPGGCQRPHLSAELKSLIKSIHRHVQCFCTYVNGTVGRLSDV